MSPRTRPLGLLLGAALALAATPARAEPPVTMGPRVAPSPKPDEDPSLYVDPSYDPAAHGGLPYGTYLRISRGTGRRSSGMMATGITFVALGVTGMAIGTGVYLAGRCERNFGVPNDFGGVSTTCSPGGGRTPGVATLLAGTLFTAIGLPLWIVGGSQVPWVEASGANDRARPATWARLVPAVTPAAAGRGVDLTWSF